MSRKKNEEKLLRLNVGTQVVETFDKVQFNPLKFPWPVKNESVEELVSPMVMNYIRADQRLPYLEEIYRVLIPDGKAQIWVPYYASMRAIQDYKAEWPPFCEVSFMYFNQAWMKLNHPERPMKCNFEMTFSYKADNATLIKNEETKAFMVKHYWNSVMDLQVALIKKPLEQ